MIREDSHIIHDVIDRARMMTKYSVHRDVVEDFSAIDKISSGADKVRFLSKFLDQYGVVESLSKSMKIPIKDDQRSDESRNQGNKFYAKNDYIAAVEKYNESLCHAESKLNLALAYANRSAVCFELEMYSTCLQNIELAKSHGYPAEKIARLDERAEKCNRLIAEGAETDDNMLKSSGEEYLKLSHPPHPKLPCISDCLDVKFNDEFGRHIVTNKRLMPGEIVCIESPFSVSLHASHKYRHCINCIENSFLSLIPCHLSTSAMFCSQKCKDEAFESYYEYKVDVMDEFHRICPAIYLASIEMFFTSLKTCGGDIEKLKSIVEGNENNRGMSILSAEDPNDPMNLLKSIDALETHETKRDHIQKFTHAGIVSIIIDIFLQNTKLIGILKTESERDFFRTFLYKHGQIAMTNSHSFGESVKKNLKEVYDDGSSAEAAVGIFPFLSLLNHSCSANVARNGDNRKTYLIVQRVIEPGEQLYDTHCCLFDRQPIEQRQMMLKDHYFFDCKCEACVKDFPEFNQLSFRIKDDKSKSRIMNIQEQIHGSSPDRAKKVFKSITRILLEKKSFFPCRELVIVQRFLKICLDLFLKSKLSMKLAEA